MSMTGSGDEHDRQWVQRAVWEH